MKGRFGFRTTLILFAIALVYSIVNNIGNYASYIDKWGIVRPVMNDALIAFAFLMGVRSLFLAFTARTRMSGWMSAIALLAFATGVLYYPFTIGAVIVGLAAFGVAWKAENKLPPWHWLPEPPPETK